VVSAIGPPDVISTLMVDTGGVAGEAGDVDLLQLAPIKANNIAKKIGVRFIDVLPS
jgi:hypothetical protein